ncbi:MAG: hypothetical protein ACI9UJ_002312, partial [bacterium]
MLYITPVILTSYYLGGKLLRNVLISELNDQLNVKATVTAVNLNGLRTFPNLSLELTNVRIEESSPHYNQYLLQARRVVVKFNPLNLLSENNEIDKIELTGGAVRLFTNSSGETNYDIFKPDTSANQTSLDIDLKHVLMTHFRVIYVDYSQDQSLNFETDKLVFSGKFKNDKFQLKTKGDGLFDHLTLGGVDYVIGKRIKADLALDIDQKLNAYHIEKGQIGMDNLLLDVKGDVLIVGSEPDLDLTFSGNNINVQSVLSILPNDVAYTLRDLKSTGQIDVNGTLNGRFTEDTWPDINIAFGFSNASVSSKSLGLNCQKINLTGTLLNPYSKKLDLAIDVSELNMKKSSMSGTLSIKDLMKPDFTFEMKGLIDFNDVKGLLSTDESATLIGKSLFNLKGNLPYSDSLESPDYSKSTIQGDVEIRDASFATEDQSFVSNLFAKSRVDGDNLTRVEIKGGLWSNDVDFKGKIGHWQSYLANQNRLLVIGELKSAKINLGFLSDSTATPDTTALVTLDFNFDADLELDVTEFIWSNLKSKNLTGRFNWDRS